MVFQCTINGISAQEYMEFPSQVHRISVHTYVEFSVQKTLNFHVHISASARTMTGTLHYISRQIHHLGSEIHREVQKLLIYFSYMAQTLMPAIKMNPLHLLLRRIMGLRKLYKSLSSMVLILVLTTIRIESHSGVIMYEFVIHQASDKIISYISIPSTPRHVKRSIYVHKGIYIFQSNIPTFHPHLY